ncbi:MAG TPA: DUF6789 family protein [Nannocystaceae bacterium]|nr:DUF6789 family protein [Nannocystaceae bacterium]
MTATNGREAKLALGGGAAAGAIAGAVLVAFMTVMSLVKGLDVWSSVFKGASAPFFGEAATQPGFDLWPVLVGALCHFAISIGWGMLFGLLFYGVSKPATVLAGALWGVVVWIGMFYVVLPIVGLREMAREAPVLAGVVYHVVFGLALGAGFLPFQHRKPTERTHHRGEHLPAHG